jgi:SMODS-associated and fused to various effectors sensor domain
MKRIQRTCATKEHVFAALPTGAAVGFGRLQQKKLHPELVLYDYQAATGGFHHAFTINGPSAG